MGVISVNFNKSKLVKTENSNHVELHYYLRGIGDINNRLLLSKDKNTGSIRISLVKNCRVYKYPSIFYNKYNNILDRMKNTLEQ